MPKYYHVNTRFLTQAPGGQTLKHWYQQGEGDLFVWTDHSHEFVGFQLVFRKLYNASGEPITDISEAPAAKPSVRSLGFWAAVYIDGAGLKFAYSEENKFSATLMSPISPVDVEPNLVVSALAAIKDDAGVIPESTIEFVRGKLREALHPA
ncbi:MAG: hypothetical protein NUW37_09970 [Planctomycetes bacterium]|nr:hypothetical protein [Planctomycetota bacterium]